MTDTRVKSCPSCHTPFQRGDQVVMCPRCGALHHHACWQQDGGCRQPECPSAQRPADSAAPAAATPPAPVVDAVPPAAEPAPALEQADEMAKMPEGDAPDAEPLSSTPPPADPVLDRLLSEAHLRLRQGVLTDAEQLLAEAKKLSSEYPGVLELEGDLASAKGKFALAERLYRQAFHADRGNARLEEKFATALLKMHEPELLALPDDSTWSDRVKRNPTASGIMSALLPGLGQFHNGDYIKGAILVVSWAMLWMSEWRGPILNALNKMHDAGLPYSTSYVCGYLFHGGYTLLTLLVLAVWLYSIIDAVQVAQNP